MTPQNLLAEMSQIPTGDAKNGLGGGDGIKKYIAVDVMSGIRTVAGLVLTAATAPAIAALETNFIGISAAAGTTFCGELNFKIPADYDPAQLPAGGNTGAAKGDYLQLHVRAVTSGSTDTPTLGSIVYNSRAGVALSSAINNGTATVQGVNQGVVNKSAALSKTNIIDLSGNKFLPGDVLSVDITATAHATDGINIYDVQWVYKGNIVTTDMSVRST